MSCSAGPDIVENGLVLALDAADFNSFKGEATTNEIVSVTWSGDGGNQASFTKESVLITDGNLKYKGYETYLWSPGTSNNCYLNGADLSTGRTSTVWTFSCYVKREDGAPITSLSVYMYYPSSDGSAAGTIEDVGNGWYRVSRTRTGTVNYLSLIGFTGFTTGYKYYLSGAQLEKKSYATTFVATNTTRGTTVATGGGWADLIGNGNHGELVNGVRESADNLGALVFDGTDDYVSTNFNPVLNSNRLYTYEIWFKDDSVGGFLSNTALISNYGGSGTTPYSTLHIRDNGTLFIGERNTAPTERQLSTSFSVVDNTWKHIVATATSNELFLYVNGISIGTSVQRPGGTITSGQNFVIGGNHLGRYQSCNIAIVRIYLDRALTPAEIQQNFNMLRGRFGI